MIKSSEIIKLKELCQEAAREIRGLSDSLTEGVNRINSADITFGSEEVTEQFEHSIKQNIKTTEQLKATTARVVAFAASLEERIEALAADSARSTEDVVAAASSVNNSTK